jgi:hypothetical protein
MSLEVHIDKQDIHTLTTLPRYEGAHSPADVGMTSSPTQATITFPFSCTRSAAGPVLTTFDVDVRTSTPQPKRRRPVEHRFASHDARRGDVAGEGSVRARG